MDGYSQSALQSRLVAALYQNSAIAVVGNAFIGVCVVIYYWALVSPTVLIAWLGALLLLNAARFSLSFRYHQLSAAGAIKHFRYWYYAYGAGVALSGICWGSALLYMMLNTPLEEAVLLYISVFGLISAAIGMSAAAWPLFVVYVAVCLLPTVLVPFLMDGAHQTFVLMTSAYFVITLLFSFKTHAILKQSIIHQLTNDQLLMALQREKDQVMRLNSQLEKDVRVGKRTAQSLLAQKHQAEELAEKLYELSVVDGLTGIANRRVLEEKFPQEWSRARRQQTPLVMLMVDIDHFKALNDHYGHQYGDECLKQVATILKRHLKRPTDFLARYGGEEFVVLLPETTLAAAAMLAEDIRQHIERAGMVHRFSKTTDVVTVSIGIAGITPSESDDRDVLFERADKALYQAKHEGRNRVVTAVHSALPLSAESV